MARGHSRDLETHLYEGPLIKNDRTIVKILAMGMEKITETLEAINHKPATQLFPDVDSDNLIQPIGQLDMLIGIQDLELHPGVTN